VSLAATFTPVFTLGLGGLPPHLYSHGSSMLGTLQQVAAAFGTALVVTVMSARTGHLVADGVAAVPAQVSGMKLAFGVATALAVVTIVVAAKLPSRATGTGPDTGTSPSTGTGTQEHGGAAATGAGSADEEAAEGTAVEQTAVERPGAKTLDGAGAEGA
jgi:MFS transporter, DHA2 family, lincomycin resistance protein